MSDPVIHEIIFLIMSSNLFEQELSKGILLEFFKLYYILKQIFIGKRHKNVFSLFFKRSNKVEVTEATFSKLFLVISWLKKTESKLCNLLVYPSTLLSSSDVVIWNMKECFHSCLSFGFTIFMEKALNSSSSDMVISYDLRFWGMLSLCC